MENETTDSTAKKSGKFKKLKFWGIFLPGLAVMAAFIFGVGSVTMDRANNLVDALTTPCTDLGGKNVSNGLYSGHCVLPDGTVIDPTTYTENLEKNSNMDKD